MVMMFCRPRMTLTAFRGLQFQAAEAEARDLIHASTAASLQATRPGEMRIGSGNSPRCRSRQIVALERLPVRRRTASQSIRLVLVSFIFVPFGIAITAYRVQEHYENFSIRVQEVSLSVLQFFRSSAAGPTA